MLTFLFLLCILWISYWSFALWRDKDRPSPVFLSRHLCVDCAQDCAQGSVDNQTHARRGAESSGSNNASKPAVASKPSQSPTNSAPASPAPSSTKSGVVPLFTAPSEVDDLKEIKGVGKVMERTLNDLGVTTFKQLSEFQDAEVQMVSDVLSESNAGFGDRIKRDEWVNQAKVLAVR